MSDPPLIEPPEDDVWWEPLSDDLFDVLDRFDLGDASVVETDPGHLEIQVEASPELPSAAREALQHVAKDRAILSIVVVDRLDDSEVGIVQVNELPPPHEW